jgi:hypothetical protein
MEGAHRGAVGWGTALQAGRPRVRYPMVSLKFFNDTASNRCEDHEYFLGVKSSGAYGSQSYHLYVPAVMKSGSLNLLKPSGRVQTCRGTALTFYGWLDM